MNTLLPTEVFQRRAPMDYPTESCIAACSFLKFIILCLAVDITYIEKHPDRCKN